MELVKVVQCEQMVSLSNVLANRYAKVMRRWYLNNDKGMKEGVCMMGKEFLSDVNNDIVCKRCFKTDYQIDEH